MLSGRTSWDTLEKDMDFHRNIPIVAFDESQHNNVIQFTACQDTVML
jgi:hypothetical protein